MKYKFSLILLTVMSLLLSSSYAKASRLAEIDNLIKKYGKLSIHNVIFSLSKDNSITVQDDNGTRVFFGPVQLKYINKYTISKDLHRTGTTVKELEQLLRVNRKRSAESEYQRRLRLVDKECRPKSRRDRQEKRFRSIGSGTGWVCRLGYIVTSYNIIANKTSIFLLFQNGNRIKAKVAITDKANDIAILIPQDVGKLPHALPISAESLRSGSKVFTIGFPYIDVGIAPKLTSGEFTSTKGMVDDPNMIQFSTPIQPGNIGGPILNMKGQVVDVVRSNLSTLTMKYKRDLPQNINYGVKAKHINKLLEQLSLNESVKILGTIRAPLEKLAERIQPSVMIVIGQ